MNTNVQKPYYILQYIDGDKVQEEQWFSLNYMRAYMKELTLKYKITVFSWQYVDPNNLYQFQRQWGQ